VKGKLSNLTKEPSAGAGESFGGQPPPTRHGAAGEHPEPGDSDERGSGDERRRRGNDNPAKRNKQPAERRKRVRKR